MNELSYTTLIENLKTSDDKQKLEITKKLSLDCNNTIPLLWLEAIKQDNPRAILAVIRDLVKKEKPRGIFKRTIGKSKGKLSNFLKDSDAKVRKNACGIIGEMGDSDYLEALYSAYEAEQQLFVRPSYALSIGNCGKASDAKRLQKILDDLISNGKSSEDKPLEDIKSKAKNEKHISEEKLALTRAIAKLAPDAFHDFKGFNKPVPMILTAMDDNFQVTLNDLKEKSIKGTLVNEGVLVKEKDLNKVYASRTFYEVIFPIEDCKNLQFDYKIIASSIVKANILTLLNECHENSNNTPFYYRVEFKTTNFNMERSEFVKNLSRELDELSSGNLRNSPSSYEVEIRIIENKKLCSAFIKLYSYNDTRFNYRYKSLSTSINPVTAAIVMKAISKWLQPSAKVIDPFCGTGTMLVERSKVKDFKTLTGVDIFRSAIEDATINTNLAKVKIELITEDILEFSTLEMFDEMISNMPFESKAGAHDFSYDLYKKFVNKIHNLVRPRGMVFLYTVEKNLLKENLIENQHLQLIDEIKITSGGLSPHVFVIKVK